MFTGLVREVGTVLAMDGAESSEPHGARLQVEAALAKEVSAGDSVLVNGVCLTATRVDAGTFAADLSPETLRRTTLGAAAEGTPVNLEVDILAKYVEKLLPP